jgi:hypothetical protein
MKLSHRLFLKAHSKAERMAPGYIIAVRAMAKKPGKWTSKTRHSIKPQKGEIISEGQTIINFATQL